MTIREESRFNLDMVEMLIRNHLVSLPQYDMYLANIMENGLNQLSINFVTQLMQRLCLEDKNHPGQPPMFTEVGSVTQVLLAWVETQLLRAYGCWKLSLFVS